jgi:hypothetical protein
MPPTTKIDDLIASFDAVNADAIALVETCPDARWRATCPAEAWPAGVVAHHIAVVHGEFLPLVRAFAGGATYSPGSSTDDVDRTNAEHARTFAGVGKPETADLMRTNGDALSAALRAIADDALDAIAGTYGGREMTVAQVVEWIVIGHARSHLDSLRAAIAS